MSIKRGKQINRGPQARYSDETPLWLEQKAAAARKWDWATDVAGQPEESFVAYAMTASLLPGTFVSHSKFGKGIVTAVDGPNADVLFEAGSKRLRFTPK